MANTSHGSSKSTAIAPNEHVEFCSKLASLEQWALVYERLEAAEPSIVLPAIIFESQGLRNCQPGGTKDQELELVQRLTKLRRTSIGQILACKSAIDEVIRAHLSFLASGKAASNFGVSYTFFLDKEMCTITL